jgi:opacity protein-like surface antigen
MTAATAQNVQNNRQRESKHELSIYGLGGYSPIVYTLDKNGSVSGGAGGGGGAGLGYTFNLNSSFGIVAGVEMTMYGAEASFEEIPDKYTEETVDRPYEFSYTLKNYKEKQSVTMFSIPVMAKYGVPIGGGSTQFYAAGGFKLGFPVSAKADIASGTTTTSVYGIIEQVLYENIDMPHNGLVVDALLPNTKKDLELGFSATLALEAGLSFTLTDKINLYTGAYLDYGLNSIQKTDNRHLLELEDHYDQPSKFIYNSVLDTGLTEKINLMSVGLKLRIGFRL